MLSMLSESMKDSAESSYWIAFWSISCKGLRSSVRTKKIISNEKRLARVTDTSFLKTIDDGLSLMHYSMTKL